MTDTTSVLTEALDLVNGARQAAYGKPEDNWADTSAGWAVIFRDGVTPARCAMAMVWAKLCRELTQPKRDNRVDAAGYVEIWDRCAMVEDVDRALQAEEGLDGSGQRQGG